MSDQSEETQPLEPNKRAKRETPKKPKVKIEVCEEESTVTCPRCDKAFYNTTALRNHHKIQHGSELSTSELSAAVGAANIPAQPAVSASPQAAASASPHPVALISTDKETPQHVTLHIPESSTEKSVVSILKKEAKNLVSLASENISYIIIKTVAEPETKRPRVIGVSSSSGGNSGEPVQLTGPFECLQRSSYLPSGTCHQIFFNCCEYSLHFRQEHSKRRKPGLRCQVCERQLDGMATANDTAHTCSLCPQSFEDPDSLTEHTRSMHARPKPFQCQICLKSFTQQGGLQQHMRMHTGDRPFPCAICSKAFTQKAGLDQHLRIHTKLKPFRCVVCDKSFSQSVHLKQHMRTHTNIQPFQCGACGRRFKQSSHLNFHLKSHQTGEVGAEEVEQVQYTLGEPDHETVVG